MTGDNIKAGATAEKKSFGQKWNDRCQNFGKFMWNAETKEFMGRTGSNWAKIGLFYLIFYGFLAGFFAAMLAIFLSTLNPVDGEGGPTLTQFIKNQPGLTRLDQLNDRLPASYNFSDTKLQNSYRELVEKFLKGYSNTDVYSNVTCDPDNLKGTPAGQKPCKFDISLLGNCSGVNDSTFGLATRKPCIFIRINKVFNWVPEPPTEFPNSKYLHLDCTGTVIVEPKGFLISAFPFRGQKGYQAPIVSVQVDTTSAASDVECQLRGKDISVSASSLPERSFGKIKLEKITSYP